MVNTRSTSRAVPSYHQGKPIGIILPGAQIQDTANRSNFVPFLGAGASSFSHPSQRETTIRIRLGAVDGLLRESGTAEDEPERAYLKTLAAELGIGTSRVPAPPDDLTALRAAVLRLYCHTAKLFGTDLAGGRLKRKGTECDLVGKDGARLANLMGAALDAALDAKAGGFPAKRVHEKLATLACLLLDSTAPAARALDPRHRPQEGCARKHPRHDPRSPKLCHDELTWLAELFWFTLQYGVPTYPTSAEMAFEVGLLNPDAPPRTLDLTQTAQIFERHETLVDTIREIFQVRERLVRAGRTATVPAFHMALAASMKLGADAYLDWQRTCDDQPSGAVSTGKRSLPILFTTNFDRMLEEALWRVNQTYHVVYPVLATADQVRAPGRDVPAEVRWLMKTVRASTEDPFQDATLQDVTEVTHARRLSVEGPVVVKLHGSPLDRPLEDQPAQVLSTSQHRLTYEDHALIVSEAAYLAATSSATAPFARLPSWITDDFQGAASGEEGRKLWFLGYSLSDWNIRTHLFAAIQRLMEGANKDRSANAHDIDPHRARGIAVNKGADPERYAILRTLDVAFFDDDLAAFGEQIANAHGIARVLRRAVEMGRWS